LTVVLSRRMHGILWQNIAVAIGIKSVSLMLALFGDGTMWMAVFARMGASLIICERPQTGFFRWTNHSGMTYVHGRCQARPTSLRQLN